MTVSGIFAYPLKSGSGNSLRQSEVLATGLKDDRMFAVVDANKKVLTAREYPELLGISANVNGTTLTLQEPSLGDIHLDFSSGNEEPVDIRLFRNSVKGTTLGDEGSEWISALLGLPCQLIAMNGHPRPMELRHGGKAGDVVSYADASPLHILSEASLADLNARLASPVTVHHFRPNIVVKGSLPYEEDQWKTVVINNCTFEVHLSCERCVFATIDPVTREKNREQEPLRTLAQYRKQATGGIAFGVYLLPRKTGQIHVNDQLIVK